MKWFPKDTEIYTADVQNKVLDMRRKLDGELFIDKLLSCFGLASSR